ncbi:hypothetical protein HaLaN_28381 [Haematococcus lacustris]|uniref:Uncharacterized protein n=1 Tax=Haematococcus lacustris TaxID=44745 RepID=A0A6A0AAR2_HAELA|nr:hypothetical protein HaLaN_28381 [Haematococcus lacustris]
MLRSFTRRLSQVTTSIAVAVAQAASAGNGEAIAIAIAISVSCGRMDEVTSGLTQAYSQILEMHMRVSLTWLTVAGRPVVVIQQQPKQCSSLMSLAPRLTPDAHAAQMP